MKRFRLKIGVDVDDVLMSCNEYALERVNRRLKLNPPPAYRRHHELGALSKQS